MYIADLRVVNQGAETPALTPQGSISETPLAVFDGELTWTEFRDCDVESERHHQRRRYLARSDSRARLLRLHWS